ncbi:hypothetical protein TNCV_97011 [Trichonephila clavipes]|nr:hypothetical protein TNCV_97011 [Trichonephila clavipes]
MAKKTTLSHPTMKQLSLLEHILEEREFMRFGDSVGITSPTKFIQSQRTEEEFSFVRNRISRNEKSGRISWFCTRNSKPPPHL